MIDEKHLRNMRLFVLLTSGALIPIIIGATVLCVTHAGAGGLFLLFALYVPFSTLYRAYRWYRSQEKSA